MAKSKKKSAAEHNGTAPRPQHLFKVTCTFRYAIHCPADEIMRLTLDMSGAAPEVVDADPIEGALYPRAIIQSAAASLGVPCTVEEEPHIATLKQVVEDEEGTASYLMRVQCWIEFFTTFTDRETRRVKDYMDEVELQPSPRALRAFTKAVEAGMQTHLPLVLVDDETTTELMGSASHGRTVDLGEPRMLVMMKPGFYVED